MKWYETIRPGGDRFWWTQRDKRGVCFTIKRMELSRKFRLLVNNSMENSMVFNSLQEAMNAAQKMWNNG